MPFHRSPNRIAALALAALLAAPVSSFLPAQEYQQPAAQPASAVAPPSPSDAASGAQPTSAVAQDNAATPAPATPAPATPAPEAAAPTQAPDAAPPSSSTAEAAKPSADDKDDDDDDDDAAKPADAKSANSKSAPQKKGLFGPKKLPYCKPGQVPGAKPVCRIKLPRMTPVSITEGTLTVNGMIAKVGLNYQIADLKFLYFWVPGTGIVIVTDKPFPNAKEQPNAFHSKGLTVKINDQVIELYSDNMLLRKDRKPISAWVALDPTLTPPLDDPHFRSPSFGWGATPGAPYAWPGSQPNDPKKHALAPPVPVDLRPIIAKPTHVSLGSASISGTNPAATPAPASGSTPAAPAATTPATPPTTPASAATTPPAASAPAATAPPVATPPDSIPPPAATK